MEERNTNTSSIESFVILSFRMTSSASSSSRLGLSGVGLQILLSTNSRTFLVNTACTVVGTLYPAYASLKSIEYMRVRDDTHEATKWLMYWAVFGMYRIVEEIALPSQVTSSGFYSPLRLGFLLWLQLPRFSGAYRVTVQYMRPFLHAYYPCIDMGVDRVVEYFEHDDVKGVLEGFQRVLSKIPFLEWFMRYPDNTKYIGGP